MVKNKIVLSIVIPARNSEKTIGKLLLSINNSNFKNFNRIEAAVVDDYSEDGTKKIVRQNAAKMKFPLQLLLQNKQRGPGAARNKGAKAAKGKYLFFLDSDTQLKKNTLQIAFDLVKKNNIKAFTGIWDCHQETTKFFPQFKAFRDWSYWLFERQQNSRYYLFSTRVAGIDKKLFFRIGGFDENYSQLEDFDLTYRIEKIAPIKFCPELQVFHEFEDFWPIAKKYFKRSHVWAKLYLKRYKFDPVATSQKEAVKAITASAILFFILTGIFWPGLLLIALILFIIYSHLEWQFWLFLLEKKGWRYLFQAIPVSIVLYVIIMLGAGWGIVTSESSPG